MDISDLTTRQIANALVIFAAAMPFGRDAVKAALMTAAAESSFKRYANDGTYNDDQHEVIWRWYGNKYGGPGLTLEQCQVIYRTHMVQSLTFIHDAVAGSALTTKDSVGHYQQREMYGYGTIVDLMDPAESTRIFLRGVPGFPSRVRHWSRTDKPKDLTIAQACQWVQGSEFPTGENYAPMEAVADQLINHFGGLPADKPLDWLETLMADQKALDDYRRQITGGPESVNDTVINILRSSEFKVNAGTVWEAPYNDPNAPDGETWPTPMHAFVTETNRRVVRMEKLLDALTDAVARLEAK